MKTNLLLCLTALFFASCIGTDVIELTNEPSVSILTPVETLQVGDTLELDAEYTTRFGGREETNITWTSLNENIIQIIDPNFIVAVDTGTATIVAAVDEARDSLTIQTTPGPTSFNESRAATFQGKNNYTVNGSAELEMTESGLVLKFGEDFVTQRGPGLYIYLGNSGTSIAGAVDLGEIKEFTGEQTYEIPEDVELNSFNFILVYCKPFGASFGCGVLEE
ncbi:MAG: DM13 domain-containing protein [Bacteroidota bacterium]